MGLPPPANVLMGLAARDAYRTHAVCQVLRLGVNRMPEVTVGDGVRKGAQTLCLWVPHGPLSALPCDEAPPCPHPALSSALSSCDEAPPCPPPGLGELPPSRLTETGRLSLWLMAGPLHS